MRVAPARIEDCEQIARGMRRVAEEGWLATEAGVPLEDLVERYRAAVEWDEQILLALWDGEELVGSAGMHPTSVDGVLTLGMWVLPSHRGRGGGRMLIEAAIEAVPPTAHKVELEVFPDNEAAIALYRSMGFEQEGLRRDHYRREDGALRSALLMARLFPRADRESPSA